MQQSVRVTAIKERHNVRMLQAGSGADFNPEPFGTEAVVPRLTRAITVAPDIARGYIISVLPMPIS